MAVIISAIRKSAKPTVCPASTEDKEKQGPCFAGADVCWRVRFLEQLDAR